MATATREVQRELEIVELVHRDLGIQYKQVARIIGADESTLHRWLSGTTRAGARRTHRARDGTPGESRQRVDLTEPDPRSHPSRSMRMTEIIFIVEEAAEGGYIARAVGASILHGGRQPRRAPQWSA